MIPKNNRIQNIKILIINHKFANWHFHVTSDVLFVSLYSHNQGCEIKTENKRKKKQMMFGLFGFWVICFGQPNNNNFVWFGFG